jgi:hypothetical protein
MSNIVATLAMYFEEEVMVCSNHLWDDTRLNFTLDTAENFHNACSYVPKV